MLNSYNVKFVFETSGKISPWTNQGSSKKDPCWWPKHPKAVLPRDSKRRQVTWSTLRRWWASSGTYPDDLRSSFQSINPSIDEGQPVCGPTLYRWATINCGLSLRAIYFQVRGEHVISHHFQIRVFMGP